MRMRNQGDKERPSRKNARNFDTLQEQATGWKSGKVKEPDTRKKMSKSMKLLNEEVRGIRDLRGIRKKAFAPTLKQTLDIKKE